MTQTSTIMDYWPSPDKQPRQSQIDTLLWIEKNYSSKRFLFVEAPVGSGKSLIGMTLSRFLDGDTFVLTPQRILQKQYEDEFASNEAIQLRSLYGKTNYSCASKHTNCDTGSQIKPACDKCPHSIARSTASYASNVVLNYDLALLSLAYTETFSSRRLMILDECHSLERILTEFDAISISFNQMQEVNAKWTQLSDIIKAQKWVSEVYISKLRNRLESLESIVTPLLNATHGLNPDEIQLIKKYTQTQAHYDEIAELELISEEYLLANYVLVHDKMNIKFKRLRAGVSFNRFLKSNATTFLFMSSTILDYEGYCRDNGIPLEEAAFISIDSEFPPENRPVYYMPQQKMNITWDKDETKQLRNNHLSHITELCNMHKNDNGVIHTANYKIAEWLVENLKTTHKILHHNPGCDFDRNDVIEAYMNASVPTILISPSITEGLDLKDDLARFAIITKVPFPNLGDQWIKARQQESSSWYQRQALTDVIQGCGRIVRSKTDSGNVYITDASWGYLYSQCQSIIPSWWKDAYLVME